MSYPIGYNLNNQYGIQGSGYANNLGLQGQTPFMGQTSDASIYTAYNTPTQNIYTPDTLQYTDLNQMMTLGRYQALSDPGGGPNDLLEASDGNYEPEFVFESSEEWNLLAALARGFTHYKENAPNTKPTFTQTAMSSYLDAKLNLFQLTSPPHAPAVIVQPPVTPAPSPAQPPLVASHKKHSTTTVIPETTPSGAPPPPAYSPLLRSYSDLTSASDDTLSPLEQRMKKWIKEKETPTNQSHIQEVVDSAADLSTPLIDQYYNNLLPTSSYDRRLYDYLSIFIPEYERELLENFIRTSTDYRRDQKKLDDKIKAKEHSKTTLTEEISKYESEKSKLEKQLQDTENQLQQTKAQHSQLEDEVARAKEQKDDIATQITGFETQNQQAQAAFLSLTEAAKQMDTEIAEKEKTIQELKVQEQKKEESSRADINSHESKKTEIAQKWSNYDAKYQAQQSERKKEIDDLEQELEELEESEKQQKSQLEADYNQAKKAYQEAARVELEARKKLKNLETQSNQLTSDMWGLKELASCLARSQTASKDKLKELNQTFQEKHTLITQINTDLAINSLAITANGYEISNAELDLATLRSVTPPPSLSQYLLTPEKLKVITKKIKARPTYITPISITEIIEGPNRELGEYIKPTTSAEHKQRAALATFVREHREQILKGQNIDGFVGEYNRKLKSNYPPNYKSVQEQIQLQEQRLKELQHTQADLLAQQSALQTQLSTTTAQADLDTLTSNIQARQTELAEIRKQASLTQQEINQKQKAISTIQQQINTTQQSINELQAQRPTLKTTRDTAWSQKEAILTDLAAKKAELEATLEKKKKASQKAKEEYTERENKKNSDLEAENAKIKAIEESRQKEHDDYTNSIEELQKAADELQSQKEKLKKQIEEKGKKIEENENKIAEQTKKSKDLENTINTTQQELRANEKEQKDIQADIESTTNEINKTARDLQKKSNALEEVESRRLALIQEKATLDQTYRTDSILFPRQKSLMEAWHQEADALLKTKKYLDDTDIKTIKAKLVEQLKTEVSQLKQLRKAGQITAAECKDLSKKLKKTYIQITKYIENDFAAVTYKAPAKPAETPKATPTPSSSTPSSSTPEGKPTTPNSSATPPEPSKPTTESSPTAEDTARQEQIKSLQKLSEAYKKGETPTSAQADLALEEYQKSQKAIINILSTTTENEAERKAVLTATQTALKGQTDLNAKIAAVNNALAADTTDTGKALYKVFKQNPDSFIDTIKNISPDTNIQTIQRKFGSNSILKQQSFGSVFKSEFTQDLQNKGDWAVTGIQAAGTVAMAAYEEYQATGKIGEATADAAVVGGMEAIGGKLGGDLASGLARAAMAGGKVGGTWGAVIGAATAVIGGFVGTKFFGDLGKKLTGNDG